MKYLVLILIIYLFNNPTEYILQFFIYLKFDYKYIQKKIHKLKIDIQHRHSKNIYSFNINLNLNFNLNINIILNLNLNKKIEKYKLIDCI